MPTIVLVDDDDALRPLFTRALERAGFQVFPAASGGTALVHLEHLIPDLIVTDLTMPVMSGAELVRAVKRRPELAHVPILLISGSDRTTAPAGYLLLEKPFPLRLLVETAHSLIHDP